MDWKTPHRSFHRECEPKIKSLHSVLQYGLKSVEGVRLGFYTLCVSVTRLVPHVTRQCLAWVSWSFFTSRFSRDLFRLSFQTEFRVCNVAAERVNAYENAKRNSTYKSFILQNSLQQIHFIILIPDRHSIQR